MLYFKIKGERIDIIQKTNSDSAEGGKVKTTNKRVMFLERSVKPSAHHFYSKPKQMRSLNTTGVDELLQGFETTPPFKTDDLKIFDFRNNTKDKQRKVSLEANSDPPENIEIEKIKDPVENDIERYKIPIKENINFERNFVDETVYKENNTHEPNYISMDLASDSETPEYIIKGVYINPTASNTFQLSNMSHSDRHSKYKNDTTRIPVCLTFIAGSKRHKSKNSEDMFIFSPCTKSKNQLFEVKVIDDLLNEDVVSSSSNRVSEEDMSSDLKKVHHKHKRNNSARKEKNNSGKKEKNNFARKVEINRDKNRNKSTRGVTDSEMELMKKINFLNDSSSSKSSESTSSIFPEREKDKSREKQGIRNHWMGYLPTNKQESEKTKDLKKEPKENADPFEAMISQLNSSFENNGFKNFKI